MAKFITSKLLLDYDKYIRKKRCKTCSLLIDYLIEQRVQTQTLLHRFPEKGKKK